MARKARLKFTKICKYIVNAGMPNEAVYDDISDPIWINDDTDYYIVKWQGKAGIIDQDGVVRFPFRYDEITSITVDKERGGAHYVIGRKNGDMWISSLSNPQRSAGPYYDVKAIFNRSGLLFFIADIFNGLYRLLGPSPTSDRAVVDDIIGRTAYNWINLNRMYNLALINLTSVGGFISRATDVIIDEDGKVVYAATEENTKCHIERWDNSENTFIVSYFRPKEKNPDSDETYAMEFLIVSLSETGEPKVLLQKIPRRLFRKEDEWLEFLKEKGLYYYII